MKLEISEIIIIYKQRISLLRELLDCVDRERSHLINRDINSIWSIMEEKNRILESIEKTKEHILQNTDIEIGNRHIPLNERQSIAELSRTLNDLKQEIKVRVRENMLFINETLGFFHDIVSVFATAGRTDNSYGPVKYADKKPILYKSEV